MTENGREIPVLYRDDSLVVCRKPVGIVSEGEGMPAMLSAQLGEAGVFCVHRLDRAVGGLMVFALKKEAAAELSRQTGTASFQKEYLAVIQGAPEQPEGILHDLLFHDRDRNKSYVVRRKRAGVKEASLSYRCICSAGGMSLLRIRLHTGRTHQIRVQFASRSHPLIGDVKYGSPVKDIDIALWSYRLGFRHPKSGEKLCFSLQPPQCFPWDRFQFDDSGDGKCDTLN